MASKLLQADDLVSCSACAKPFNSKERLPKILRCLHVVCNSCSERLLKDVTLRCDTCLEDTKIGPSGAQKLPTDQSRLRLKQLDDISQQTGTVPCHACPDSGSANYYCQDCNHFYCKECRDLHLNKRNLFSKDHVVIDLPSLTPQILKASQKPPRCKEHDQPRIFFCNKADCNVAICVSCTVSDHKDIMGHNVCKVSEACQRRKEDIKQSANVAREDLTKVQTAIKQEGKNQKHIQNLKVGVIKDIDDEFEYLSRLIKERRDKLVNDAEKKCMEMEDVSAKHTQELQLGETKRQAALTFEDNARAACNETEFIDLTSVIENRFDVLNKEKISLQPLNGYNLQYKKKVPTELLKALSTSDDCIVSQILRLDLSEVTTSGAIQNTRSEIAKIVLKNQEVVADLVNVESVDATVTDSNGRKTKCEVVQNVKDKTMDVYLRATTSGKYRLTISVVGQPLKEDNEFSITVEKEQDSEDEAASEVLVESTTTAGTKFAAASSISCPQFIIDTETVHEHLKISDDGKTMSLGGLGWSKQRGTRQLRTYRGGRGTMRFDRNTTGKVYFQVSIAGYHQCEIGLCREENIDKYITLQQQPHSVSLFFGGWCGEHGRGCCTVWKSGKRLFHNKVSYPFMFGFLLDSHTRTFCVVDCKKNVVLTVVSDVDLDQPLWPVFGLTNPVYGNPMTLMSGTDIADIPECIKSELNV